MEPRLSSEDRQRLETLFERAADLALDERDAFVERECASNGALRDELSRLLAGLAGADFLGQLRPVAPSLVGTRIGPYELLSKIGEGGMGTVFEAQQERPQRIVAIKLLHAQFLSPQALRRFEREGEFLARLQHPGIAAIYAAGTAATAHGPQPYFAMELIRGVPLTEHARAHGLSVDQRLELLARVADAVQHAHRQGVIHRDLKPANILVDESGAPKIVDFGIARASESDVQLTTMHTDEGQILGTLAYMSPEQASGDPDRIDTRSDVYSLGVVLYELLTDELPYDISKQHLPEAVRIIREQEPRRPSAIRNAHRGELETIVLKSLEKDPDRRYDSAAALASDLRRFVRHEPIAARPTSRLYTLRKFVRRNKTVVVAALAVGVALLVGMVASVRFGLREAEQRRAAERNAYRANLSLAQTALKQGRFSSARELQDRSPEHLRNWEWHYLDQRWVRERARLTIPEVVTAAFLDEQRLLAVDRSCGLHLWDVRGGEPPATRSLEAPAWPSPARALALSANGRWLLSHVEGSLALGDPLGDDPPTILPFPGRTPKAGARTADVSADGARVVVATEADEVLLVDVGHGARVVPTADPGGPVLSVMFDPLARTLVVRRQKSMRAWDTDTLELLWSDTRSYDSIAFSPEGSTLFVEYQGRSGRDAGLYFESAASGAKSRVLPRSQYGVDPFLRSVETSVGPDGRTVAVALLNGELRLANADVASPYPMPGSGSSLSGGAAVGHMRHEGSEHFRLAFSPDGVSLLSLGLDDASLRVWGVGEARPARVASGHESYVYSVSFSPDGKTLASGSWDGSVRVWDSASAEQLAELTLPGRGAGASSQVLGVAFSPDGKRVARITGGSLELLSSDLVGDRDTVTEDNGRCVVYSSDGALLVADEGGHVRVWDARTLEVLVAPAFAEQGDTSSVALDAGGQLLAVGTSSGDVLLFELPSDAPRARFRAPEGGSYPGANSLAFDPGGTRLVVGWGNSDVSLLEVPSLAEIAVLGDHLGEVFAVAFSPDGTRIASGGRDGALRIWDAATGDLLMRLDGHAGYIKSVAFSPPHGRRIATASEDGSVRIWDAGDDFAR